MWIRRGLYVKFIASRLSERARETVNLVSPLLFLDSVLALGVVARGGKTVTQHIDFE